MSSNVKRLNRIFRFKGRDLADPNPQLSVEEVRDHYAEIHPNLNGAKIVDMGEQQGESNVWEFRQFGDKG